MITVNLNNTDPHSKVEVRVAPYIDVDGREFLV